jgi:hypothetical protein
MNSPYPLWKQLLVVVLMPPVMGALFALRARGWANTVQGENPSGKTIERQRKEALAITGAGWIVGFGVFIYVHFIQKQ